MVATYKDSTWLLVHLLLPSATNNRNQWEREGVAITKEMLAAVENDYDSSMHFEPSMQELPEQATDDVEIVYKSAPNSTRNGQSQRMQPICEKETSQ